MRQESRDPQHPKAAPRLLPAPPSYPLLAARAEPRLLSAPPSYPLLGPPRNPAPAPDIPLSEFVGLHTQRLLNCDAADVGDHLRTCVSELNQRLTSRDGSRTYYAYPTEALERVQKQLAEQGRSAANLDEAQAWRHLSRGFALAIQKRGEGR